MVQITKKLFGYSLPRKLTSGMGQFGESRLVLNSAKTKQLTRQNPSLLEAAQNPQDRFHFFTTPVLVETTIDGGTHRVHRRFMELHKAGKIRVVRECPDSLSKTVPAFIGSESDCCASAVVAPRKFVSGQLSLNAGDCSVEALLLFASGQAELQRRTFISDWYYEVYDPTRKNPYPPDELFLVGRLNARNQNRTFRSSGLELMTREQFDQWSMGRNLTLYSHIRLTRYGGNEYLLRSRSYDKRGNDQDIRGNNADDLVELLEKTKWFQIFSKMDPQARAKQIQKEILADPEVVDERLLREILQVTLLAHSKSPTMPNHAYPITYSSLEGAVSHILSVSFLEGIQRKKPILPEARREAFVALHASLAQKPESQVFADLIWLAMGTWAEKTDERNLLGTLPLQGWNRTFEALRILSRKQTGTQRSSFIVDLYSASYDPERKQPLPEELWVVGGYREQDGLIEMALPGLQLLTRDQYEIWKQGKELRRYTHFRVAKIAETETYELDFAEAQGHKGRDVADLFLGNDWASKKAVVVDRPFAVIDDPEVTRQKEALLKYATKSLTGSWDDVKAIWQEVMVRKFRTLAPSEEQQVYVLANRHAYHYSGLVVLTDREWRSQKPTKDKRIFVVRRSKLENSYQVAKFYDRQYRGLANKIIQEGLVQSFNVSKVTDTVLESALKIGQQSRVMGEDSDASGNRKFRSKKTKPVLTELDKKVDRLKQVTSRHANNWKAARQLIKDIITAKLAANRPAGKFEFYLVAGRYADFTGIEVLMVAEWHERELGGRLGRGGVLVSWDFSERQPEIVDAGDLEYPELEAKLLKDGVLVNRQDLTQAPDGSLDVQETAVDQVDVLVSEQELQLSQLGINLEKILTREVDYRIRLAETGIMTAQAMLPWKNRLQRILLRVNALVGTSDFSIFYLELEAMGKNLSLDIGAGELNALKNFSSALAGFEERLLKRS